MRLDRKVYGPLSPGGSATTGVGVLVKVGEFDQLEALAAAACVPVGCIVRGMIAEALQGGKDGAHYATLERAAR